MTRALFLLLAVTTSAALAATSPYADRVWFRDGTGLEIFAETSDASGANAATGRLGFEHGRAVRIVLDAANNVLFAYIVEGYRDTQTNTVVLRVRPLDSTALELVNLPPLGFKVAETGVPTVPAVRDFPPIRIGEVVTLDILENPAPGQKVYDVLRPIADPSPHPEGSNGGPVLAREQLSLKNIALRVNGQGVSAPPSWIMGTTARIDVPGHGAYVIATYDPTGAGVPFSPTVVAARQSLTFSTSGDAIEITSQTDVLTTALQGTLWVYHDPNFPLQEQTGGVGLETADTVERLLQKK